jgi:hypothetical protein
VSAVKAQWKRKEPVEALSKCRQSSIKTPWKLRSITLVAVRTPRSLHVIKNIALFIAISRRFVKFNNAVQTL